MNRTIRIISWLVLGVLLLVCSMLMPAHWQAVDRKIIERAGANTPSLVEASSRLLREGKRPAVDMMLRAVEMLNLLDREKFAPIMAEVSQEAPSAIPPEPVADDAEFAHQLLRSTDAVPVITKLLEREARERVLAFLRTSRRSGVEELLKNRALTNTVRMPPALSSAGQPLDAAISLAGLLVQADQLTPALADKLEFLAKHANEGGSTGTVEGSYLDLLSLGTRLTGPQLIEFMRKIEDTSTLHTLAEASREHEKDLPALFVAVAWSEQPKVVSA